MTNSNSTLRYDNDSNASDFNKRKHFLSTFCFIYMYFLAEGHSTALLETLSVIAEVSETRSIAATMREARKRVQWKKEVERFDDIMFLRLFRMYKPCFYLLCTRIERVVGQDAFKSDDYLENLELLGHSTPRSSVYQATMRSSGHYISGEIKVALTLRYLAGGSYLDMYLWYNISPNHVLTMVCEVCKKWFCNDQVMKIDFYEEVLQKSERISEIRNEFATRSDGILGGCIGALDGWLVKIFCPNLQEVNNPGKYMSRKGFFALNTQAIVDKRKRILWRFIGEKGSSHDSTVFKNSSLYKHLMLVADELHQKSLYLVGDSAYSLRSFLLCPYDNAASGSTEDNFNFFLSSQRIYVECAFGEIDRRFGIFWRPLMGSLEQHQYTIDACLRLHNLIVDYREGALSRNEDIINLNEELQHLNVESYDFMTQNAGTTVGVYRGDAIARQGRPTLDEAQERNRGVERRNELRDNLARAGLARPTNNERNAANNDRHNRMVID